jgi:hypothetical protein
MVTQVSFVPNNGQVARVAKFQQGLGWVSGQEVWSEAGRSDWGVLLAGVWPALSPNPIYVQLDLGSGRVIASFGGSSQEIGKIVDWQ